MWPVIGHMAAVSLAGSMRPGATPAFPPAIRFRVLIPARDEQGQIGAAVESVLGSDYPSHLRDVVVIADNCSDETASVARAAGAEVWERSDPVLASKGAALEWALGRLACADDWDAVVLLDADGRLHSGFLETTNARLLDGAAVVQGERRVVNAGTNIVSWLSQVSSAAQWVLRPRGRARLGAAAKLLGSGMVIRREVLDVCPWRVSGLAEDTEYWLALLTHGIRPVQEPRAVVSDIAPTDMAAARVQRSRWEAGKVSALGAHLGPAGRLAFRRRDVVLAEAVVSELVFPNLSVTGALVATAGGLRWVAGRRGAGVTAVQTGVLVAHLALGLRAAEAPPRAYAALLLSPVVAVWRIWVTVEATLKHRRLPWRRTPRASDGRGTP
jgi:1,2-diacylglycerol 3-beta-glucosyltransferase